MAQWSELEEDALDDTSELVSDDEARLERALRARRLPVAILAGVLPLVLVPTLGTGLLMCGMVALFATHEVNQGRPEGLIAVVPLLGMLLMSAWHFWGWMLWVRCASAGWGGSALTLTSCFRKASWHSLGQLCAYTTLLFMMWMSNP